MTAWLVDKSALVRIEHSPDVDLWSDRTERGLVRMSTLTRLEVGYSARCGTEGRRLFQTPPLSRMPVEYLVPAAEDRALAVQHLLADRSQHRAPSVSDLLIAAAAELGTLTVLHHDKDFETIGAITDQPMERLRID